MKRKILSIIVALVCFAVVAGALAVSAINNGTPQSQTKPTDSPEASPQATPSTLTLVAAGDVLLHLPVNDAARTETGHDYTPLFSAVTPYIEGADLAICGMETSLAPPGEEPSAYPIFGAPDGIVSSLKASGWDGCSNANNHSADRGFAQLTHTLDVFDENDLGHSGTARTEEESKKIQFYTLRAGGRDVNIAHLSYTSVDNGIPAFDGKPWAWNVTNNERATHTIDELIERSRQAREKGADLVVVSFHWGNEYETVPNAQEQEIAQQLADSKAIDLVLGSHPHVAQPIDKLDGGPDGQGMWIIYSLGNYISSQREEVTGLNTITGIISTATIEVPASGPAHVTNLEWTAVTLDNDTFHIYLLSDLESGRQTSTLSPDNLARRRHNINEIMGTPERTELPVRASELVSQERR